MKINLCRAHGSTLLSTSLLQTDYVKFLVNSNDRYLGSLGRSYVGAYAEYYGEPEGISQLITEYPYYLGRAFPRLEGSRQTFPVLLLE